MIYMNHSIIIEESLKEPEILRGYNILRTKFSARANWHLHIVETPEPIEEHIQKIQAAMTEKQPFYFHIYDEGKTLVVVFKQKIFYLDPNDKSSWQEAREYGGRRLNIPAEQLDFYPSRISEEDSWYI